MNYLILGMVIFLTFNTSCAGKEKVKFRQWPYKDHYVEVRESHYLDLGLRVLALELTQQGKGQKQYFFEFLPRLGKIEGTLVFNSKESVHIDNLNRARFQKQITWETQIILAGIQELVSELKFKKGFDPKKHVQIHFQLKGSNPLELALYEDGEIQWLYLSGGGNKSSSSQW